MTTREHPAKGLLSACRSLFGVVVDLTKEERQEAPTEAQVASARRCIDLALLSLGDGRIAERAAEPCARESIAARVAETLLRSMSAGELPGSTAVREAPPERDELPTGLAGSSDTIPLPDLLGFLRQQGKTGLLRVFLADENLLLEFERGELVSASSDNAPPGHRLGEILVAQGWVDRGRLESILEGPGCGSDKLGAALVTGELVTEEHLRGALELQVQEIFHRMFSAPRSHFRFREAEIGQFAGRLRLNVIQLLLESARFDDESAAGPALG